MVSLVLSDKEFYRQLDQRDCQLLTEATFTKFSSSTCNLRISGVGGPQTGSTTGFSDKLHAVSQVLWCTFSVDLMHVTFGRLAVSDSELGVDVIDFDECYCYLFTVLYCSLVLHAGPF